MKLRCSLGKQKIEWPKLLRSIEKRKISICLFKTVRSELCSRKRFDRTTRNLLFSSTFCECFFSSFGQIINKMKLPQSDVATCLTLFPSNGALLCGTQSGSIYVIRTPFSDSQPGNLFHYLAHSAKVTRVKFGQNEKHCRCHFSRFRSKIVVAFHEALIISCCRDGDLMLWSTQTKMSFQTYEWSPVFLLSKSRSEEMVRFRKFS